ncbi:hypothetical protein K438DRAFT_108044 [Mycena galopus ATCC 62051]|nr:hypothetical protein K438DRAFT_108044 [Mycena galopus ATCC 62051]
MCTACLRKCTSWNAYHPPCSPIDLWHADVDNWCRNCWHYKHRTGTGAMRNSVTSRCRLRLCTESYIRQPNCPLRRQRWRSEVRPTSAAPGLVTPLVASPLHSMPHF